MIRYNNADNRLKSLVISKAHNKAHTATGNRIARRFQTEFTPDQEFDIEVGDLKVNVETSASVIAALQRLQPEPGRVYVALTNKDGLADAVQLATGRVGIMDSHGNIVRECEQL